MLTQKNRLRRAYFGCFDYKVSPTPEVITPLDALLQSNYRLQINVLLLRPGYPNPTGFTFPCCRLQYLTLSKPFGPIKSILVRFPAFQITSSQIYFWWSRGELNPRPTCLLSKGITTILLTYHYNMLSTNNGLHKACVGLRRAYHSLSL